MFKDIPPAVEIDTSGFRALIRIKDPAALEFVKSIPCNRQLEAVTTALLIGLRAMATSTSNGAIIAMTDQVQAAAKAAGDHVNAATDAMGRTIKLIADRYCAEDGILAQSLEKVGSQALDPDKAETLVRLRQRISADIKMVFDPLAKQLADTVNVNDETKPFGQMAREIKVVRDALAAIKTHLDTQTALVASSRANPTYSGRSHEDFVLECLGEVAAHQGETLEDVRNIPGLVERSRAGDMVTTIDGRLTPGAVVKVVIEAKNRPKSTTLSGMLTELDRAMGNRRAAVGFGILVNPTAPAIFYDARHVVVNMPDFGSPGADCSVYAELVRIGYDMARFIAIQSARAVQHEPTIDMSGMKGDVDDLSKATEKFSTLKDNHTRIETAVSNARTTADEMKADLTAIGIKLRKRLNDAITRLNGATDTAA